MKHFCSRLFALAAGVFLQSVHAYPPAPDHQIYGIIRDEMGYPIQSDIEVIFETSAGVRVSTRTGKNLEPGINYRLKIPMDAGIRSDSYKPTALRPIAPFKIKVKLGQSTYLPIEMRGDYSKLGLPGQKTVLNLTLGEDADGDGIPDAWERAMLERLGPGHSINEIDASNDLDGDGLSNMDEYLAGTYAADDKDGFALEAVGSSNGNTILKFMSVRGRAYTLVGSSNFTDWTGIQFREVGSQASLGHYNATETKVIQVEALSTPAQSFSFYKLLVQ